jgi:hypothetical protein
MFGEEEEEEFPAKLLDSKLYIRISDDGEPQLVRVIPVADENGVLDPSLVAVFLDEGEAKVVPRTNLPWLLESTGCVPVEEATNWKHKRIN